MQAIDIKSAPLAYRPEVELLLFCTRTNLDSPTSERIEKLVKQDIDWEYLLHMAAYHEVTPFLYQSLNKICPKLLPQTILKELSHRFYSNFAYNLFLTQELHKILELFTAHDIRAIPFKGPILAISAYNTLALRQFRDLDILVQERDVPLATKLLVSQGYELPSQLADIQEKPYLQYEQFLESSSYQRCYDFIRNDERIAVELHWGLTGKNFSYPVEFQDLWSRIQFVSLENIAVPSFSSEDLLLYLCVHGSRHCWEELKWICDIAELLHTHQGIDWKWVLEQSRVLGVERMLGLGLLLAHEMLGTILPENVLQSIQADRTARVLAQKLHERFFDSPPAEFEKHFLLIQARERLLDKALYLRHLLFTPSAQEWALLPLPQFLVFFYCLLRPTKLIFYLILSGRAKLNTT